MPNFLERLFSPSDLGRYPMDERLPNGGDSVNVFGRNRMGLPNPSPNSIPDSSQNPSPTMQSPDDIRTIFNQLYTPDTKYSDMYGKQIEAMPQRENPSKWRRFGSIFMGDDQQNFINAPYYNKLADWELKRKAIEPAMQNERYQNTNERVGASSVIGRLLEQERISSGEKRAQDRLTFDRQKEEGRIKLENDKLALARLKLDNPNWNLVESGDGMVYAYDKHDKELKLNPTGMKAKDLSGTEKLRLGLQNAKELQALRHSNRMSEIAARGANAIATKKIVPGEGSETETGTTSTVYDKEGKPIGTRATTVKKKVTPGSKGSPKTYKANGKTYNIPPDKIADFMKDFPNAQEVK